MKTLFLIATAALVLAGCNSTSPGQRAGTGALLGAGTGAAIGAIAGGGRGAAIGAIAGGATGAAVGAATTPQEDECYVRDARGVLVRVPC